MPPRARKMHTLCQLHATVAPTFRPSASLLRDTTWRARDIVKTRIKPRFNAIVIDYNNVGGTEVSKARTRLARSRLCELFRQLDAARTGKSAVMRIQLPQQSARIRGLAGGME